MEEKLNQTIPDPPQQLHEGALEFYNELYQLLIDEGRGEIKYKHSVAVAANSLYYYTHTVKQIPMAQDMGVKELGESIRALNSASMEWSRAAKVLMLTPEAELRMRESPIETTADAPPTLNDVMGELLKTRSRNDNYGGKKKPQSNKAKEDRSKATLKKGK